jgi:hypothetical protein
LIQSPDEEILVDIAQTIYLAVTQRPQLVEYALELGFLSRFRDIHESTANFTVRELSLAAVCALISASSPCQRRMLLSRMEIAWPMTPFTALLIDSLAEYSQVDASLDADMDADNRDSVVPSCKQSEDTIQVLNKTLLSYENKAIVTVGAGVTRRDVLSALRAIFSLPQPPPRRFVVTSSTTRIKVMYEHGLLRILFNLIVSSMFDIKLDAGHLYLDMIVAMDYQLSARDLHMTLQTVDALLQLSDGSIVSRALNALESIFVKLMQYSRDGQLAYEIRALLCEHAHSNLGRTLGALCLQTSSYQSSIAEDIMDMLESLTQTE